jgi:hypothetical protein
MTSDTFDPITDLHSATSIFKWMPTCALIIDKNGIILEVNEMAISFFKASTQADFIFDKENIKNMILDTHRANELINSAIKGNKIINREILLRKFDKSIASVELNACLFPDDSKIILIQFRDSYLQNQNVLEDLSSSFKKEVLKLKPYLNKPGKEILDKIIVSNLLDEITKNKPAIIDQAKTLGEKRIEQITKLFPQLSNSEIILCGYFSLKMSVENISHLTRKSPNCLRVAFHRILKKTHFESGKDLIRTLQSLQKTA